MGWFDSPAICSGIFLQTTGQYCEPDLNRKDSVTLYEGNRDIKMMNRNQLWQSDYILSTLRKQWT